MRPKSLCLFEFIDKFHICFDITMTNVESGHGHAGVKESDDVLDLVEDCLAIQDEARALGSWDEFDPLDIEECNDLFQALEEGDELASCAPGRSRLEDDTHDSAPVAIAHPRPEKFQVETSQDDRFRALAARHFTGAPWRSVCALSLVRVFAFLPG